MPIAEGIDLKELSSDLHGYTGADIKSLCREAAMKAIRRYLPEIDLERCLVHVSHTLNGFTGNPSTHSTTAELTTSTNLHIQRDGTGNSMEIAWYIIEFPKNISSQNGLE